MTIDDQGVLVVPALPRPPHVDRRWVPKFWLRAATMRVRELTGLLPRHYRGQAGRAAALASMSWGDFRPSRRDVIVCTFPKSGTNALLQMLVQLAHHARVEFEHIHDVVPWPDDPFGRSVPLRTDSLWEQAPEHLRIVKSHLPFELLPASTEARYIACVRHPTDSFVSSYKHMRDTFGALRHSPETWLRLFLTEDSFPFGGNWAKVTASYWRARELPNVLLLSYRQIEQDLRGVVEAVARFLGTAHEPALLDRVAALASREHMLSIAPKFDPLMYFGERPQGVMVRRRDDPPPAIAAKRLRAIEPAMKEALRRLGAEAAWDFVTAPPQLR